jgi:hypothetical protein
MSSVLKPRLPWRPAALIEGVMLAAVLAVAPAHASQAPTRPAPALSWVSYTDDNGVINTDGIQGTGA